MNQNDRTSGSTWPQLRLAFVSVLLAGASTAVFSQAPGSAAAKPPAPKQWVECAPQEGHCVFEGKRLVRFGSDTRWVEREFTGTAHCSSRAFGSNPAQGALKTCQIEETVVQAPVLPKGDGTAELKWTPPTQSTDDKPLKQIGGYRIRYGIKPDALTELIQIPDAKATSYAVKGLGKGRWYFAVVAYMAGGYESEISNVVTKTIE